jgi:hypothetical protein
MERLWLLEGSPEAPGWGPLESDARAGKAEVLLFDRTAWALLRAAEAPAGYPGLAPGDPPDGLYLDPQGRGLYLVGGAIVQGPLQVIAALGPEAKELLGRIGDPDAVLERLGRVR